MILSNVRLNQYIAALIGVECDSDSYYLNQFSIFVKSEYNIKLTDTNQNNFKDKNVNAYMVVYTKKKKQ